MLRALQDGQGEDGQAAGALLHSEVGLSAVEAEDLIAKLIHKFPEVRASPVLHLSELTVRKTDLSKIPTAKTLFRIARDTMAPNPG